MRTAFSVLRQLAAAFSVALLVGACAGLEPGPPPLTAADIVQLSKAGEAPASIVDRLGKSGTVLWLSASELVSLGEAGVANQVLDYLQAVQMAEVRRRSQFEQMLYGPEMSPFSRCGGLYRNERFSGFFAPFC